MDNGGEMPLYNNCKKNNTSSGQKQLQMQFDAWMNSLNIDKVPETVSKEMNEKGKLGKGKGKTAADFASSGKERTLKKSKSSIQTSPPNNIKKGQSKTSSGILFGAGGTTTVHHGHVAYPPTKQSETSKMIPEDPTLVQNTATFDNNNNGGNNKNNNVVGDNDDAEDDDDVIILSPPPPPPPNPQVLPSSSGVWSDLDDIFPSLDPVGEDVPLTQRIQETPIWEWDYLYFP